MEHQLCNIIFEYITMYNSHCGIINIILDNAGRKRKFKSNEFLFPEKRKKPVTVTDIF